MSESLCTHNKRKLMLRRNLARSGTEAWKEWISTSLTEETVKHVNIGSVEKAARSRGKRPGLGERRREFKSQFRRVAV